MDWLFGMFGSGKGKKAEREKEMQKAPSELAEKYPMPPKYELALEEGNGETAKRLLALLASGEKSRSELAAELGVSSQPWLSASYLNPLMKQGYIAQVCIASRGKVKKLCMEVNAGTSADVSIRALRGSGGLESP